MPETSVEKTPGSPNDALAKRLNNIIGFILEGSLDTKHPNVTRFVKDAQGNTTKDETPEFKKLRDEFLDSNKETKTNRWKGFAMSRGKLPGGPFIGKDALGFGLMRMIEREGKQHEDPLRLAKILAMFDEGRISLAQLREAQIYYKLVEARCNAMSPEAIEPYPEKKPPTEAEILACELIDQLGEMMGNPLVEAVMDQDSKNQSRQVYRRAR